MAHLLVAVLATSASARPHPRRVSPDPRAAAPDTRDTRDARDASETSQTSQTSQEVEADSPGDHEARGGHRRARTKARADDLPADDIAQTEGGESVARAGKRLAPREDLDCDEHWHIGIGPGSDIPLDAINVGVEIRTPFGLQLSSSLGFIPNAIVDQIDAVVGDPAASPVVHAALHDAVVWRTHLGVKPWTRHGFYAGAGYGRVSFGGSATTADAVSALVDRTVPMGLGAMSLVHISSTVHMLDVEVGWEWRIARRLKLRTAVAAATTLAASSSIRSTLDGTSLVPGTPVGLPVPAGGLPTLPLDSVLGPLERQGEDSLNATLRDNVRLAMFTVQLQFDVL
jgi:hypothetical protein